MDVYILVIAHPDDESMFFLPTLNNLVKCTSSSTESVVNREMSRHCILCLSNGNYDGLGMIRATELKRAASIISPSIDVAVIDHPQLQDGPKESWPKHCIEGIVLDFLEGRYISSKNHDDNDGCKRKRNITILTFDAGGVSGHPNHIDTYLGLKHIHHLLKRQHIETEKNDEGDDRISKISSKINFEVMVLDTIQNPIIKYFPFVELIYILLMKCCSTILSYILESKRNLQVPPSCDYDEINYYMINPILVWRAMKAHSTQFVWYRRLFVIFSRYSYINNLRKVQGCNEETVLTKKIK